MRGHPIAALVVAAVLCGGLVAAGIAAALPGKDGGRGARGAGGDPLAPATAPADDPAAPSAGPPLTEPGGLEPAIRPVGDAAVEARARDPLGGPDWVVRTFPVDAGRLGGRMECAQLGREHGGRFGWVDAANRFRPQPVSTVDTLSCAWPRFGGRRRPQLQLTTRVSAPGTRAMRPLQSVAWGIAGRGHAVALTVDGRARELPRTPSGVVLAPLAPSAERPTVRAEVSAGPYGPATVAERSYRADGLQVAADAGTPEGYTRAQWVAVPVAGRQPTLEYRVPDPAGGAAWGVVAAPARDGGWCVSQLGRVAAGRVGHVDDELGTFTDAPPGWGMGCGSPGGRPTLANPVSGTWSAEDGDPSGQSAAARRERTVRRVQPGRTMFSGVVHPDVRTLTIATPRDVRTLTPSPRAHAFAVVYDGMFEAGEIRITATFVDGRVYRAPPRSLR